MRGISPIVSTILMVAIAIAAAVVVYYITMDVVTQQGAQLQEQAETGAAPAIRIVAASLAETEGDRDLNTAANEEVKVYYTLLNTDETNIANLGPVTLYIFDEAGNVVCVIDDNLAFANNGEITLKANTVTNCNANFAAGATYYLQVTAGDAAPSNKYKVTN